MSSIENTIIHDHIYLTNSHIEKESHRRIIRKKDDIQTDEDREEYIRRRKLNNKSCRISRIHRRSQLDLIIKKCNEYEELNMKLGYQKDILTQVINHLKEHLRTLVPNYIKQN